MLASLVWAALQLVVFIAETELAPQRIHPGHNLYEWSFAPVASKVPTTGELTPPQLLPFEDPVPPTHTPMPALDFKGLHATDRRLNLLKGEHLPTGPFTCELWINDNTSRPVGVALAARDAAHGGRAAWIVGYHDHSVTFAAGTEGSVAISSDVRPIAHHKHWYHIAAVYTGEDLQLFVNGRQFGGVPIDAAVLATGTDSRLEIAAYLESEPLMQLGHLVTCGRLYEEALTSTQVARRFAMMKKALEQGWMHPGRLHINAGPYLTMQPDGSIRVLWETDRPTSGLIEWGTDSQMNERISLPGPAQRILHATLSGLKPATTYFYRVRSTDPTGLSVDSGVKTFHTAPPPGEPVRIGVIGGTDVRPHIADHLAGQLSGLKPHAMINLGSLTDGGGKDDKHLWNLGYFRGIGPLHALVPAIVLPGDGESDRFWFDQYHPDSSPDGCTSIRYGDAEFFLLDTSRSVPRDQHVNPAHASLRRHAAASTATWKIVCHHRAMFSSVKRSDTLEGNDQDAALTTLFDELGIDMVLSALPGGYERSVAIRGGVAHTEGIFYTNTGGGGADPITFPDTTPWYLSTRQSGHHFILLDISPRSLHVTTQGLDSESIDAFQLEKSAATARARQVEVPPPLPAVPR